MIDKQHPNMHSTVNELGSTVTQIIHFSGGNKRTYHRVLTESIKQGQFTKFRLENGTMLMINDSNVDCIEIFPE